jgi:hypothetical protein
MNRLDTSSWRARFNVVSVPTKRIVLSVPRDDGALMKALLAWKADEADI